MLMVPADCSSAPRWFLPRCWLLHMVLPFKARQEIQPHLLECGDMIGMSNVAGVRGAAG